MAENNINISNTTFNNILQLKYIKHRPLLQHFIFVKNVNPIKKKPTSGNELHLKELMISIY